MNKSRINRNITMLFLNRYISVKSFALVKSQPADLLKRQSQSGAAMLVALIVIAAFVILAATASQTIIAMSHEAEKAEQLRQEKGRAEYYASMAEATLKYDVRENYNNYQNQGKQKELQLGGNGSLPMFDPLNNTNSRPLLTLNIEPTGVPATQASSLYGNSAAWAEIAANVSRDYIASKVAEKNIADPDRIEILSLSEAYRRTMNGVTEPIYAFRYTARAVAGNFAEIVKEDTILLGPTLNENNPSTNCNGLLLSGSANPANVNWGDSTTLNLIYTGAEQITISRGGTVIFGQPVTNQTIPQNISYTTPGLTGPATFVGEVTRGTCQVQVPIVVGNTFNQNLSYTVNGAQTINIIEGDQVQYNWQVTNAASGYTNSWITFGSDPSVLYPNIYSNSTVQPGPLQSTTSTLHAQDTRLNGNAEQSVNVNINVCRLTRIFQFEATPGSVVNGAGGNVRIRWQTGFASRVRINNLTTNSLIQEITDPVQVANGFIDIPAPTNTTNYGLEAFSDCGAPTATAQTQVTVTNAPCSPPDIPSFAATPTSVNAGDNQTIRFSWVITNNPSSVSINNGVGGGLPPTGIIDISQPNVTTTYTITAVGCSVTRTAQVTVTVNSGPPPPPGLRPYFAVSNGLIQQNVDGGTGQSTVIVYILELNNIDYQYDPSTKYYRISVTNSYGIPSANVVPDTSGWEYKLIKSGSGYSSSLTNDPGYALPLSPLVPEAMFFNPAPNSQIFPCAYVVPNSPYAYIFGNNTWVYAPSSPVCVQGNGNYYNPGQIPAGEVLSPSTNVTVTTGVISNSTSPYVYNKNYIFEGNYTDNLPPVFAAWKNYSVNCGGVPNCTPGNFTLHLNSKMAGSTVYKQLEASGSGVTTIDGGLTLTRYP